MELGEIFQIIRKRLWLIVLGTLLAGGVSYWVSYQLPPVYRASTSLLVTRGLTDDDPRSFSMGTYTAVTYKALLTKRPVIEAVARTLGLDPKEIEEKVQIQLVPDTALIELTVKDSDPHLAMEIANGIVTAFMEISRESGWIRTRDLVVVEPAIVPTGPGRGTVIYTFLGAFVGLNLCAGLAFLQEHLDRSLKTGDDVRQILSLPVLGTIPRLRSKERRSRLVTSTLPHSPVSEAYRTLRTNIRSVRVDQPLTTLLITSAERKAGKTAIAANLGIVCAPGRAPGRADRHGSACSWPPPTV